MEFKIDQSKTPSMPEMLGISSERKEFLLKLIKEIFTELMRKANDEYNVGLLEFYARFAVECDNV